MSRKSFYGWLAATVSLVGLAAYGLQQMDSTFDVCEDTVMQQAISPDAHLRAIVYSRSCGVFSTGFTTQVALVRDGDPIPREAGNVYVERSEYFQPQVSVQWEGNNSLLIEDNPDVKGRSASWEEKRVRVDRGWFRSTNVAVRYADLPSQQKTKRDESSSKPCCKNQDSSYRSGYTSKLKL